MKYILISLSFLFSGCVNSTAQWVVDKTTPKDNTAIAQNLDNNSSSGGLIYNDTSSQSWNVVLALGFLIMLFCIVPYVINMETYTKVKNYIIRKPKS